MHVEAMVTIIAQADKECSRCLSNGTLLQIMGITSVRETDMVITC
jgi:hypothetical protein